jgi:circadian clock protein KaiC
MDTWLLLRNVEFNGERNRTVFVRKSRGMAHSNQMREFVMTDRGIDLVDVYLGGDRMLTGSARVAQEARERSEHAARDEQHRRALRQRASRQRLIDAQIAVLQAEAEMEAAESGHAAANVTRESTSLRRDTDAMARQRGSRVGAGARAKAGR